MIAFDALPPRVRAAISYALTHSRGQGAVAVVGDPERDDCCVVTAPMRVEPPVPPPRPTLRVA